MILRTAATAALLVVLAGCARHEAVQNHANVPSVPTLAAKAGTFTVRVDGQGRVGSPAGGESRLAFAQAGVIRSVAVHVGERVQAGETLATLDTRGLEIDLAQARDDARAAADAYGSGSVPSFAVTSDRAKLASARSRLRALRGGSGTAQSDARSAEDAYRQSMEKIDVDRANLAREQTLFAGGVAAGKDVEAARSQLALDRADADANRAKVRAAQSAVADARLQAHADVTQAQSDLRGAQAQIGVTGSQAASAQAKVASAERMLATATLVAPADGVVTAVLKHAGEATDATQPAVVVGPVSTDVATLTIVGSNARAIRPGAEVTLNGSNGARGTGRVRAVVPSVDPATQTTTVVVDGVPAEAAPGDAVQGSIVLATRRGIVVPSSALVQDPQSGKTVVFVRKADGSFVERNVGIVDGDDRTSLVTGVHPGERVATEGAFDLLAPAGGG